MKKIFILFAIFLFVSCGIKKEISQKEFQDIMETNDYTVTKYTDSTLIPPQEKLLASKDTCKVEYLSGHQEGLEYLYNGYVYDLKNSKTKENKSKNIIRNFVNKGSEYIFETDTDIKIAYLSKNTLIYADCMIESKNEILKVLKSLG